MTPLSLRCVESDDRMEVSEYEYAEGLEFTMRSSSDSVVLGPDEVASVARACTDWLREYAPERLGPTDVAPDAPQQDVDARIRELERGIQWAMRHELPGGVMAELGRLLHPSWPHIPGQPSDRAGTSEAWEVER